MKKLNKIPCIICKKKFVPTHFRNQICSDECRLVRRKYYSKTWSENHPEYAGEYREKNREKVNAYYRKQYAKNIKSRRDYNNDYQRNYLRDPVKNLKHSIMVTLRNAMKTLCKTGKSRGEIWDLLGCTPQEFLTHLNLSVSLRTRKVPSLTRIKKIEKGDGIPEVIQKSHYTNWVIKK